MDHETPARRRVVVDGSNLATEGRTLPSLAQLNEAVETFLEEFQGFITDDVTVIVDASFGHRIDSSEVAEFDRAVEHGEVVTPPAGAIGRGDGFILRIAEKSGALVLSNDSFQEFHAERPWLFEPGRLIGGKPIAGVGWVFTPRTPVRGPRSRSVTAKSKRQERAAEAEVDTSVSADGLLAGEADTMGVAESVTPEPAPTRRRRSAPAVIVGPDTSDAGDTYDAVDKGASRSGRRPAKSVSATKAPSETKSNKAVKSVSTVKPAKPAKAAKAVKAVKATKAAKAVKATKAVQSASTVKAAKAVRSAAGSGGTKAATATSKASKASKTAKAAHATKAASAAKSAAPSASAKPAPAKKAAKAAKTAKADSPVAGATRTSGTEGRRDGTGAGRRSRNRNDSSAPEALNDAMTFITFVAEHPIGSRFEGEVVAFTSHGAHVDVGGMLCHVPLRGLGDPPPQKARLVFSRGEKRTFELVSLDAPRRRAELALADGRA